MILVNTYVTVLGTEKPVGLVESLNGDGTATVRWGVSDKRVFRETLPVTNFTIVPHKIISPDDITKLNIPMEEEQTNAVS